MPQELAIRQDIAYSEEKNGPRTLSAPKLLGLLSIIFKRFYWHIQQISGERLQDHWSSGLYTNNNLRMLL